MITTQREVLKAEVSVHAPVEKVWDFFTDPKQIIHWNNASDDWHTPKAENDVRAGGKFNWRMEARDGNWGFDFNGEYTKVEPFRMIEYQIADGRKVQIFFESKENETLVTENFEAEETHSIELQKEGWQAILNNFKKHVELSDRFEKMHFEIIINAPVQKVFQTMLSEHGYKEWTAAFNPSSHFEGNWEKGSKILFIGTDEDGKMGGMVSRIRENIPNKFVSIEHLGMLQNGEEITSGSEVESWAGAMENYSFGESNGNTLLKVDVDTNHQFKSYFEDTWPVALGKLKEICER